jgi:hypothetical protein
MATANFKNQRIVSKFVVVPNPKEILMPIQTSFVERAAFFTLKLAPSPILDVAGLFAALAARPQTPAQLAEQLRCQERGMQMLLAAIGYVDSTMMFVVRQ